MTTADFDFVRGYVRDQAAIVIEPGKEYLVESRLHTLARREKLSSPSELIARLRTSAQSDLHRKVVDAMTTNETSFFRDLHPFEALHRSILPQLMAQRKKERQLNLWCGASSTGQEPYSVLMTIAEHCHELLGWNLKYVATELCQEALDRARRGRYTQLEVNRGLPASYLVKYFTRHGAEWEFRDDLRKRVEFHEMNLVREWVSMPPMDIIFLRNVLIYFDVETKKTILRKVRRLLRPGGFLILGGAETTMSLDEGFSRVQIDRTSCYQLKD